MNYEKKFEEIVASYLPDDISSRYKEKPYYEIRYKQNGESCVGFGTYKPEVLSKNIREHFMPQEGHWIKHKKSNCFKWFTNTYTCSECGVSTVGKSKFCRNCGAKMEK